MSNTSATGGYLLPTISQPLPSGLSLEDFIHSVIVGVTGYAGSLVRPKFQVNPPKQPAIETDWIAFAIQNIIPDANAYVGMQPDGTEILARMEKLEIQIAFYGTNALENISVFRDSFQIQQNLEAMRLANIGFNGISTAVRGPDLINQRWVDRYETTLTLVRTVQRIYPVLSFASARGSIHTVIADEDLTIQWNTEDVSP
jgi:hypothetical protein